MNKEIEAAFDRRIAGMKAEEAKLSDALAILEQVDFSVFSGPTRALFDKIPWRELERSSGRLHN